MAWYADFFDRRYLDFHPYKGELAGEEARFAVEELSIAPGARILDLGCGAGWHSVELAKLGYEVTGLDLSEALLANARELASTAGVRVSWVRRDMRELAGLGPFDACVCLYTALGFFEPDDNLRVLEQVRDVLTAEGRLLLDVTNFPVVLRGKRDVWRKLEGSVTHEAHAYEPLTGYLCTERTQFLKAGGEVRLPTSRVKAYAPHELVELLERAGFEVLEVFGDLRGGPFEWDRSTKQVFLAQKRVESPLACPS